MPSRKAAAPEGFDVSAHPGGRPGEPAWRHSSRRRRELAEGGQITALIGPNTQQEPRSAWSHHASKELPTADATGSAVQASNGRCSSVVQPCGRRRTDASALFEAHHYRRQGRHAAGSQPLGSIADRPASALTLAGRKRLELAKSMAMQPKVLLLDEVNAGLNASEIDGALRLIRQIAERGITILIIEHLMKVVLSLASRVLVLHHGQLIAEGSAHDIVQDKRVIEAYLGEKFARRVAAERAHG
jgi:ATPase subunit of ABC transporter with duplicated ATPase domains